MQLYGVNGDLLAEVNVDSDASIGQIIARCRSGARIGEDTLRDWQKLGVLSLMGRNSTMVWTLVENYTKIMRTGPVKRLIHKRQHSVVFQLIMRSKYEYYYGGRT